MKMRFKDIVKEIPANLVPTYKSMGWEEISNKPFMKPSDNGAKLTKGLKDNTGKEENNEE